VQEFFYSEKNENRKRRILFCDKKNKNRENRIFYCNRRSKKAEKRFLLLISLMRMWFTWGYQALYDTTFFVS
jgi:hypothetical protein